MCNSIITCNCLMWVIDHRGYLHEHSTQIRSTHTLQELIRVLVDYSVSGNVCMQGCEARLRCPSFSATSDAESLVYCRVFCASLSVIAPFRALRVHKVLDDPGPCSICHGCWLTDWVLENVRAYNLQMSMYTSRHSPP